MIADTHEALSMLKRLRAQVDSAISSIEAGEIRANKSASVLSFYDMIVGDFGISRVRGVRGNSPVVFLREV